MTYGTIKTQYVLQHRNKVQSQSIMQRPRSAIESVQSKNSCQNNNTYIV